MRNFDVASKGDIVPDSKIPFPLLGIQHPNFVDICEAYLFRNEYQLLLNM